MVSGPLSWRRARVLQPFLCFHLSLQMPPPTYPRPNDKFQDPCTWFQPTWWNALLGTGLPSGVPSFLLSDCSSPLCFSEPYPGISSRPCSYCSPFWRALSISSPLHIFSVFKIWLRVFPRRYPWASLSSPNHTACASPFISFFSLSCLFSFPTVAGLGGCNSWNAGLATVTKLLITVA